MIPRLIRKFFSGITDYPHQEWRSDDDDEAGMDTEEPDTAEWVNPYQQLFIAMQLRRIQTLEAGMDAEELDIDDYYPLGQPLWDGKSSPILTDAELDVIRGLGKARD